MKERVYRYILQQIDRYTHHDTALREYWRSVKEHFVHNRISTIHSFCAQFLREHAVIARIDPDFSEITDFENDVLKKQALNAALQPIIFGDDTAHHSVLKRLLRQFSRTAIESYILSINAAHEPLHDFLNAAREGVSSCREYYYKYIYFIDDRSLQEWAHALRPFLPKFIKLIEGLSILPPETSVFKKKVVTAIQEAADILTATHTLRSQKDLSPSEVIFLFSQYVAIPLTKNHAGFNNNFSLRKGWDKNPTTDAEHFNQQLMTWHNLLEDETLFNGTIPLITAAQLFADLPINPYAEDELYEHLCDIVSLYDIYQATYQRLKNERQLLDFNDLLILTRDVLRAHTELQHSLQEQFRYILIDEFQDTNPIQYEIITMLFGKSPPNGKVFIVGDKKQAIYGFRQGDVRLFAHAQTSIRAFNHAENAHTEASGFISLENNYRSSPDLLSFFNRIFIPLFGDAQYTFEANAQKLLPPQNTDTPDNSITGHIEFILLPDVAYVKSIREKSNPSCEPLPVYNNFEMSARILAETIARIRDGHPDMHQYRTITELIAADKPAIGILLQTRTHLHDLETALREADIPYHTEKGRGFYARPEILDLYTILAFILDNRDDIALVGIMRSPFGMLPDDLIHYIIRGMPNDEQTSSVWERLQHFTTTQPLAKDSQNNAELALNCTTAYTLTKRLLSWCTLAHRVSPAELIRIIVNDTHINFTLYADENGEQAEANIEKLLDIAHGITQSGGRLTELLNLLHRAIDNTVPESEASIASMKHPITIMTIHQSKGLQFPMVILPELQHSFSSDSNKSGIIGRMAQSDKHFIGLKYFSAHTSWEQYSSLARSLITREENRLRYAEQKRLLYVGCTRAQTHLLLAGHFNKTDTEIITADTDTITDNAIHSLQWLYTLLPFSWEGKETGTNLDDILIDGGYLKGGVHGHAAEKDSIRMKTLPLPDDSTHEEQTFTYEDYIQPTKKTAIVPPVERSLSPSPPKTLRFSPHSLQRYLTNKDLFINEILLMIPDNTIADFDSHKISADSPEPSTAPLYGKHPAAADAVNEPMLIGRLVHEVLQFELSATHDIERLIKNNIDVRRKQYTHQQLQYVINTVQTHIRRYYRHTKNRPPADSVYHELPFMISVPVPESSTTVCIFNGTIDLLTCTDSVWRITDYKTAIPDTSPAQHAEREGYRLQMQCYAWAAQKVLNLPTPPAVEIHYTATGTILPYSFSSADLACLEKHIGSLFCDVINAFSLL